MRTRLFVALALAACTAASGAAADSTLPVLADWPRVDSAIERDAALEARVADIVRGMTLAQKVGQMTQAEIKSITPEDVRRYYIGSVLNGGGSWPGQNKRAPVRDWLRLANDFHAASMATDARTPIPVIWGTDAVHGHNNVFGATLFPHNIGLGAARNPELVERIAEATGVATRATGIDWVFAPTLAVAQDMRWGRSYESFSSDPALVHTYAGAYVRGLQGGLRGDGNVVATAKHFIGDGATFGGKDQGEARIGKAQMINVHGQGYYAALGAGAQTVMASFNSWNDAAGQTDYGKMHGTRALLTDALKQKMGFDGFVVSDWNGIAQVPGCSNASCPQAILAGIDMVMVPEDWKAFIANTMRQVEDGTIPQSRIDDAVTRIVRVKLRAGLFDHAPGTSRHAGRDDAVVHRELARRAVRESLVLLKNERGALPLRRGQRVVVVGKSADNLANQSGGWSLTWQGTGNGNDDYRNAESVLAGLRAALGTANVTFAAPGAAIDPRGVDAVVAVIGETPYAEMNGDVVASDVLTHSRRHPEDLAALDAAVATGKPVVTVLVSGRPLYANDLINRSQAFVAAWLPGSEGGGIADVLVAGDAGQPRFDFRGRLPFAWPGDPCPPAYDQPGAEGAALFARGYGLTYSTPARVPRLDESNRASCGAAASMRIFNAADFAPFALQLQAGDDERALGSDLNATVRWPQPDAALQVRTVQVNTQQDAKEVTWLAPARLIARSPAANSLEALAKADGALLFDLKLVAAPDSPVQLAMGCGASCSASIDLAPVLAKATVGQTVGIKVPLACFAARGVDLARVDTPFSVAADAPFAAAFTNVRVVAGAGKDPDALACPSAAP